MDSENKTVYRVICVVENLNPKYSSLTKRSEVCLVDDERFAMKMVDIITLNGAFINGALNYISETCPASWAVYAEYEPVEVIEGGGMTHGLDE